MRCEECERILPNLSHPTSGDGWMLRASRAALLREHIEKCSACAMKVAESTRLEDGLDQFRISMTEMQAPAAIGRKLLEAFRRETARRRSSVDSVFPWKLGWLSAVILLAAGTVIFFSSLPPNTPAKVESSKHRNELQIHARLSPGVSGAAAEVFKQNRRTHAEEAATATPQLEKPARRPMPERVARRAPIVASDELSLNGGGSIVRVTLPFSSLSAMGVPVRPDTPDTRVMADVWMDPFGAVVGIRLVPPRTRAN